MKKKTVKKGGSNINNSQKKINVANDRYKKIYQEGYIEGRQEAYQEGYIEGRQEGYAEGFDNGHIISDAFRSIEIKSLAQIGRSAKNNIPKKIHQVWIGGPLPGIQQLYIDTVKKINPDWDHKLWGNDELNETNFPITWKFIQKSLAIGIEHFGNEKKRYAQVCDMMRLEILFHHGGVYIDTTMEALKNFNELLKDNYFDFIVSNEDPCDFNCTNKIGQKYISNSFIASSSNNIILDKLLRNLDFVDFNEDKVNLTTGPYFLGKYLKGTDLITMLPMELIYPHGYETEYKENNPDKCISYEKLPNMLEINAGDSSVYLEYPCTQYPNSIMIKHFEVGGSWK